MTLFWCSYYYVSTNFTIYSCIFTETFKTIFLFAESKNLLDLNLSKFHKVSQIFQFFNNHCESVFQKILKIWIQQNSQSKNKKYLSLEAIFSYTKFRGPENLRNRLGHECFPGNFTKLFAKLHKIP